ncbi:MAG TPA: carboxymuconolactone decarboxylase family protein [Acidimicrobiia bacterium]
MTPRLDVPEGPGGPPVQVWNLRPELVPTVQAMIDGPYHRSGLPAREREAVRMRIAELNDCVICRDFRARSARAGGATEELYTHVGDTEAAAYTERERVAIEFAERFALDHQGIDDAFMARLRGAFSDAEVLDLSICCAAFLGLGRVLAVLGIEPVADDRPSAARHTTPV